MDAPKNRAGAMWGYVLVAALAATGCSRASSSAVSLPSAGTQAKPRAAVGAPGHPQGTRTEANASFSADGSLVVEIGDAHLRIENCRHAEVAPGVARCVGDTYIQLTHAGREHSLLFTSIYVDSASTFYRGPLDAGYRQNGHSFVLTDVDADRREDLIVWTGKEGAYGGPSYEVLLQHASGEFVVAPLLSELTIGANGLFYAQDGRLVSSSSDGCCLRVVDTYTLDNREPRLLERVIEERDEITGETSTRIERVVEGTLRVIDNAPGRP